MKTKRPLAHLRTDHIVVPRENAPLTRIAF